MKLHRGVSSYKQDKSHWIIENITPNGPINIKDTDQLTLFLDSADDELHVYVNGNFLTSLQNAKPPMALDLKAVLTIGATSTLRLVGIDKIPPYASVGYHVVLNGETIISIFSSQGPQPNALGQWFDVSYEFLRTS